MAAKEITIFTPEPTFAESVLSQIAKNLSLEIDQIPSGLQLTYQFSARKGSGREALSIEAKNNDVALIEEILEWKRPGDAYKKTLAKCKSSITVYYREQANAKTALLEIGEMLQTSTSSGCVIENGQGCLLRLEDVLKYIEQDSGWSWEKDEFPELGDVAISEWR